MTKRKPLPEPQNCPLCKCRVSVTHCEEGFFYQKHAFVMCDGSRCGMIGPTKTTQRGAINAWNRLWVVK
jgi:hypothetical protein